MPLEFGLHALVLVLSLFISEYLLFIYCLPLAAFHFYMFRSKQYRMHFLTKEEYRPKMQKVVQVLWYKNVYYVFFLILVAFEFLFAAGNFLLYNLFGVTVDLPFQQVKV